MASAAAQRSRCKPSLRVFLKTLHLAIFSKQLGNFSCELADCSNTS